MIDDEYDGQWIRREQGTRKPDEPFHVTGQTLIRVRLCSASSSKCYDLIASNPWGGAMGYPMGYLKTLDHTCLSACSGRFPKLASAN